MADDPTDHPDGARRDLLGGVIGRVAPVVLNRIDLDQVVEQLDVDAIAQRLDLDALMARLDMDALVDQLDVNAIADQLDLDALVGRLDVNAIADQLDLDALMSRIDMAQITGDVTADVATSGLDLVRRQLVRMDATVDGVFDRLLRRDADSRPDAPKKLQRPPVDDGESVADAAGGAPVRRRDVSGHYAGPVTRVAALAGDFAALGCVLRLRADRRDGAHEAGDDPRRNDAGGCGCTLDKTAPRDRDRVLAIAPGARAARAGRLGSAEVVRVPVVVMLAHRLRPPR
jgi:hypothetical protein